MATHRDSADSAVPKAWRRLTIHGHDYLVAHACFECKKSWKVSLDTNGRICPQCGGHLCEMGRSFEAPKAKDSE